MAPSLPITATLHKTYGSNGGILLRTFGRKLVITHVEGAVAKKAGLKRGLQVLSMNNVDCSFLSELSAQKLLEGDEMVTFLLGEMGGTTAPGTLVTAVLFKEDKEDLIGLGLKLAGAGGKTVCVGNLKGKAAATDLASGMMLKSINNFDCVGLTTAQTAQLLTEATGTFTVLAQVPPSAGVSTNTRMTDCVTATVEIKQDGSAINGPGLEVMKVNCAGDGSIMILIKAIDTKGAYYGSSLRVGMQVLKIQNVDCTSKGSGASAPQVQALLQDASQPGETVMVLAKDCAKQRRAPGSLMTVVVSKETVDTKLGVVMANKAGKLIIKKIADGTLGSTTELEPDMIVHSINNVSFGTSKGSVEAGQLLKGAEGLITFVVETAGVSTASTKALVNSINPKQLVVGTIVKEDADVKTGLGLQVQKGGLVITKINDESLTASTALQVGMKVLQINNVDCAKKTAKDAAALLGDAEGTLTVLVQKPNLLPGTYVLASIKVPLVKAGEEKPKVGLKFKPSLAQAAFTITGITEDSLACGSELEEGMLIKSVNNVDVASKKTSEKVLDMFKVEPGTLLNVLAMVPGGNNKALSVTELVTGRVETSSEGVTEGSLSYDDENGKIMVTDSGASGFLYGTALRSGMEVLAINNVEASVFSKTGLGMLLKKEKTLVFLAKRQPLPKGLLLTEVLVKETAETAVGIGLRPQGGKLIISSIKDGSLASNTKLLPGMELVSVDNEDCQGMAPVAVAKILKFAVGSLTVVASSRHGSLTRCGSKTVSLVTAILEKNLKDSRVGVTLVRKGAKLVITKISEDGLAGDSDLLVGMEVLSINNTDVTEMSSPQAAALLTDSAPGTLTILAKRPSVGSGSYVTAAISKETPESSIGIKLGKTKSGAIVIKSVTPQSPASFTELEAGMLIKSINNVETSSMPAKDVAKLLGTPESPITILAQTTSEVAMGRASFTSMRSLTSGRSLGDDTIASSLSGSMHKNDENQENVENLDDILESPEDEDVMDTSTPVKKNPIKAVSATPETMETITIVQGGRRESLTVKNVVDC